MEERFDMEVKPQEVADLLEVTRRTALYWMQLGEDAVDAATTPGIKSYKPFGSNRIGLRTTIDSLLVYARRARDNGYRERRIRAWAANRAAELSAERAGNPSSNVLELTPA